MEPHKMREKPKIGITCIPDFFSKNPEEGFLVCTKKPALLMQMIRRQMRRYRFATFFRSRIPSDIVSDRKTCSGCLEIIPIYLTNQGGPSR
jgi:hypothetical protein